MTNYNLSEIMTTAHNYRRQYGLNMSNALRAAWLKAKMHKAIREMDATGYDPITNPYDFFAKEAYKKAGYQVRAFSMDIDSILYAKAA